jgi:hypothetical protein
VAVTGSYVRDNPSCERFAETALLMFDILARLQGDKLPQRPRLGLRWVQMTVGEPISVTERWPTYHASRRAARQAIQTLTQDLQQAMESLIQRT